MARNYIGRVPRGEYRTEKETAWLLVARGQYRKRDNFVAVVRDQYRKRNSLASGGQYRKRDSMASSGQRAVQEDGQLGQQWPKVSAVSGTA